MKKSKFFLTLLTLLTFSIGTWAADPILKADFTAKTAGSSAYNSTWTYGDFSITNGANNNKGWTYIKFGGKNTTISTYNPCYVKSPKVEKAVASIDVCTNAGNLTAGSVNNWGVCVYSDAEMKTRIDSVKGGTMTSKTAETLTLSPTSPATSWPANSYYKVYFDLANTSTTNGIVWVDSINWYEAIIPTVTLSEKQLNWGMVKHDEAQTPKTFTITGANLTGTDPLTVTVVPTGSPFSYSVTDGSLTPSAGAVSATITVSASTENAGSYANGTYYIKVNGGGLGADTATVATYMEVGYQITMAVNDDAMGTATVSDALVSNQSTLIALADNVGIKAEANVGYEFDNWTISPDDGVDINSTTLPEALISEVFKDVTITANFSVAACTQLAVPTLVSATSTYNSVTLIWDAVENADRYEVKIWTTDESSALIEPVTPNPPEELTVTFTGREVETEYNYSIMAVGSSTYCENNNKLTGTVTTAAYPDATLTLSENGVERPWGSSLKVNSQIALPTEAVVGLSGKVLVGWSSVEIPTASDKPTSNYFELGANYTVAKPADKLYAVYATEAEGTPTSWSISGSDLTKLTPSATGSYAQYAGDQSKGGITFNIADVIPGTGENAGKIQLKASAGTIYNKTAFSTDIISIVVDGVNLSVYGGTEAIATTPSSGAISTGASSPYTYTFSSGKRYFHLKKSTTGAGYAASITVNLRGAFTYSNYITTGVATLPAPTFTVDEEEFVGSMNVGLSTTVDGATIYYQFETTPVPGDPMSEGTEYTAPVEITSTTIVYAYVAKGGIYSEVVYKTYTGIPTYDCENFVALTEGNKAALGEVVVTYVNGKNFWVKDNSGAFQIYDASGTFTLQAGDVVNGVVGERSAYQTVPQVAPTVAFSALTVTHGAAPDPVELSGVPAEADFNKYVVLKGVTFATSGEFTTSGSNESLSAIFNTSPFTLFNKFKLAQSFADDKAYDVVGVVSYYETGSLVQLYFISATESTTTAIDNTVVEGKAVKVIENGQLVIIKNGVKYNIIGAQLR